MRYLALAATAALVTAIPVNANSPDIPLVAIGLPFAPETPRPVSPTHPLFHGVTVSEIEGLPGTVGSGGLNFIKAAKRSSVNAGLAETFLRMNLLAQDPAAARAHLMVTWGGSHTPFHIGTHNATDVMLHYRLIAANDGRVLLDRDISTSAEGGGAGASMRDNGTVRAAIAANFASAANCIDHAALGSAPADCALTPQFSVVVVRRRRF